MTLHAPAAAPYPQKYTNPFVLYPPTLWENQVGTDLAENHLGFTNVGGDYVLYVSVPFCRIRCHSCPYFIELLSIHDTRDKEQRYTDALVTDLERWAQEPRWKSGSLRAVYIGGGTGSVLKTANLRRITDTIAKNFPLAADCEITLEGNARDYDDEKLDFVVASPITRISLGVQSFDPEVLKVIGSPHGAAQSADVIGRLQQRGFDNVQLDMMYNMPGHTRKVWKEDLSKLKDLNVNHLTTYLYRIHEGTPQKKFILDGRVPPPVDKESAYVKSMYMDLVESAADAGFNMYMFDHFATVGSESVYNKWNFGNASDVLGVGPGAYGFSNGTRFGSAKDVAGYISSVERGEYYITAASDRLDERGVKEHYVLNTLHYLGVDLDAYSARFGSSFVEDFAAETDKLLNRGLATLSEKRLDLTELGQDFHMNVALEFTNDKYWGNSAAARTPHWSMNSPMVDLFSGDKSTWLA
ncbi:coproporphyrinogen-III oxidase family protein [Paenarthrobacter sp. NPDC089675]|uniref:coproporphyrinogen-III oxidase family protein n=1 Tax=Paenarthrobacter sp. NPDC089675 TaxID=3364376 RepID=UPI003820C3DA